ncbi:MAG: AMP-binding protein [Enterobacterales bacterium]|nr:AMP-binding protein [Enterobacterales bacterium]
MEILSPASYVKHWASVKPEQCFLNQAKGEHWTATSWRDAYQQVAQLASFLQKYPAKSKIAIFSNNCSDWFLTDLAIMAAGHISVPIYPSASVKTINQILTHSETQLIFIGKLSSDFDLTQIASELDKIAIDKPIDGLCFWKESIKQCPPLQAFYQPSVKDTATIVYTSGTTGVPKGVVISYRAISSAVNSIQKTIEIDQSDRYFSYLPLAHIMERMAIELTSVVYGCQVSFVDDLPHFAINLKQTRPSMFVAVPRIWVKLKQKIEAGFGGEWLFEKLTNLPIFGSWLRRYLVKKLGFDNLRYAITGAAAISTDTIHWWERLGVIIYEAYGMSETLGISNVNRPGARKIGTVGQVFESCQTMIAANGEILLKASCHMEGYYKEAELSAMAVQDGWLRTGDLGEIDAQGYLSIKGRVKEIFKTSKGKYISPVPIEQQLENLFAVDQCCVFGSDLPQPIAVIVVDKTQLPNKKQLNEYQAKLQQINQGLEKHEKLSALLISSEEWTTENEMMTPTLKIRRQPIEDQYLPLYRPTSKNATIQRVD